MKGGGEMGKTELSEAFWATLKLAKCEYLRRVGECSMNEQEASECEAKNEKGYCTSIVIDLDPLGETWED